MIKIAPSLLAADMLHLGEGLEIIEKSGADLVHLDIMDGHFVPNLSFGPALVSAARKKTRLTLDVHLMISPVDKLLTAFIDAGADSITFHPEATPDVRATLKHIKSAGKKAGLALSPDTPAEALTPFLKDIDLVLIMTVYPGFGGQSFMPEMLPKIKTVRAMLDGCGSKAMVEVDGGITLHTKDAVIEAGADILVVGTAFFNASQKDYAGCIKAFKG